MNATPPSATSVSSDPLKQLLFLIVFCASLQAQTLEVTGRARVVNGQRDIPRAMFGVHATTLDEARVEEWGVESVRYINMNAVQAAATKLPDNLPHAVECLWDRYQPALIVEHADWAERLRAAAAATAKRALESPRELHIEFWNEPYLNWGTRPGVNYDGRFYKDEGRVPGSPMTLKYADNPTEHMRWTEQVVAVHVQRGQVDYLASRYMPAGTKSGETWTWRNQEYRAETRPWGRDASQTSFYAGAQNVQWYIEMLKVFAPAFKEAAPKVPLVVGWDFHIFQNSYGAWESVHKPTIDAAIAWMDGYSEHHYGGDTRHVAGSYETAAAYAKSRHGKSIRFYNTEAGGDLDPEQPGSAKPGYNNTPAEVRDRAAYTYFIRDVLHLLDVSPDKAAARAAHEAQHNKGVPAAFKMLKPLRGLLMETKSPRPDVWIVASLQGNTLAVAVFNDTMEPIALPLRINAPEGTRIRGLRFQQPDTNMTLQIREIAAEGQHWTGLAELGKRDCGVWLVDLEGTPRPETVVETQFFASELLQNVQEGGEITLHIPLPSASLKNATSARLRIVQSGFAAGQHELRLNGSALEILPGGQGIVDRTLPLSALNETNQISIHRPAGTPELRIDAGSLYLIQ